MTQNIDLKSVHTSELDLAQHDPIMDLIAVQMNKIEPSVGQSEIITISQNSAEIPMFHNMLTYSDFTPSIVILTLFIAGHLLINYYFSGDRSK